MRSERVGTDADGLARRWVLDPTLSRMLVDLDRLVAERFSAEGLRWPGLFVISGHRSPSVQSKVNPDAPGSRHTVLPSLAADLRVGDVPASITDPQIWAFVGRQWGQLGGRWGGGFRLVDLNHFDIAPSLRISEGVSITTRPIVSEVPRILPSRVVTRGGQVCTCP